MTGDSHTVQIRISLAILNPFRKYVLEPNNTTLSETVRQMMISATKDAQRFEATYGDALKESP